MRLGLVGYGNGGRHFHAPHIEAADGVELAGIVARSDRTRAAVHADFPEVPIHGSLGEMLASGVDAVTITTPPQTREQLVLEASTPECTWSLTSPSPPAQRQDARWSRPPSGPAWS